MELQWEPGGRGPRLRVNGLHQWSSYDPDREARNWVETLNLPSQATLFLAGDTGGYLQAALETRWPEVRVIQLVPEHREAQRAHTLWYWWPGKQELTAFISEILSVTGPADCNWAVWPAFERAAPTESLEWARTFRDVYRTVQGTWLTWKHSGRTWWRNAYRNASHWSRPVEMRQGSRPILVVASGPSLDGGWDVLREARADLELWALPSSFNALKLQGLTPDVAVCTDGGYWAKEHVQRLAKVDTVVLAALSSAPDPVLESLPTLFFAQGLPWERWLLDRLPGRPSDVPAQGSVVVTALQWALAATTGPVLVAGLDLCFSDFRAHARGHTVERRLATGVDRFHPWETLWGQRALEQAPLVLDSGERTSPAMKTYAGWLGAAGRWSRPIHRLAPTPVTITGMTPCAWSQLPDLVRGGREHHPIRWTPPQTGWPDAGQRRKLVASAALAFQSALKSGEFSQQQLRHWAETLCPETLAEDLSRSKNPKAQTPMNSGLVSALLETFEALDLDFTGARG